MVEFGLAAVISPVSVSNKAKSDNFVMWPDLDLACDLSRFFLNRLKSTHREFSFAASPSSLRLRAREIGRGRGKISPPPPPSGARSVKYPSGARVKCPIPVWHVHLASLRAGQHYDTRSTMVASDPPSLNPVRPKVWPEALKE